MYKYLLLLLATSCSNFLPENLEYNTLPGYPNSNFIKNTQKDVYCAQELSLALHTFTIVWDKYNRNSILPEKIGNIDVIVEDNLLQHPEGLASGITTPGERVELRFSTITAPDGPVRTLDDTAFFHELMHVALWWDYGDADADHSFGEGPWTDKHTELVEHVEDVFRGLNYKTICDI